MIRIPKKPGKVVLCVLWGLFFFAAGVFPAPEDPAAGEETRSRGSIPEVLLCPQRGEAPRYPLDMVIGALGRGEAPEGAYLFAQEVSAALIAGNQNAPSLQGVNSVSREAFISALNGINPRTYRLGSGREEPDGAVSFLIRFLGREQGITGELYLRPRNTGVEIAAGQNEEEEQLETAGQDDANVPAADSVVPGPADTEETPMEEPEETPAEAGRPEPEVVARTVPVVWEFEDLILEEVQDRGVEVDHRYDFPPYERFF